MKRLFTGLAITLFSIPALLAQTHDHASKPAMMPECAAMMKDNDDMQKHMAEMDAKLQLLVERMNSAKGAAKADATAAVVNELVMQRSMMQKQMAGMQPKMMQDMMEHMQQGMMKGMTDAMASCPMMKHGETPEASKSEHQH